MMQHPPYTEPLRSPGDSAIGDTQGAFAKRAGGARERALGPCPWSSDRYAFVGVVVGGRIRHRWARVVPRNCVVA